MILVVGYGNPQRQDDGFGWRVADRVRESGLPVSVLQVQQLTPELAEQVSHAEGVVFLDAHEGSDPGEVRCDPLAPGLAASAVSHGLSPQTLLFYAERLWGHAPRAVLLSVASASFGFGPDLSPPVHQALEGVVAKLGAIVAEWKAAPRELRRPANGR
jgi:hydrogenase maturation protease